MNPISAARLGLIDDFFRRFFKIKEEPPKLPNFKSLVKMPGQDSDIHNGFVNCKKNGIGLQADFFSTEREDGIGCLWQNGRPGFEGYPGIIHGGVIASLLDELMTNIVFHQTGQFGVTYKADFKWLKSIKNNEEVRGFGKIDYRHKKFIRVKAYLYNQSGRPVASSTSVFYLPTVNEFKKMVSINEVPEDMEKFFRGANK